MEVEIKKKVVVIGGGTGIFPVLQGLKKHHKKIDITAVISMTDSGGSTGRLRDEFGMLPVGDVRMALTALASESDEQDQLLRKLFLHRFDKGEGLGGHNFGNLLLVALTEILGSEAEAVKAAAKVLRIRGRVLPVTADQVHLVAEYDDGTVVTGEHFIDEPPKERADHTIKNFYAKPTGSISPAVAQAMAGADIILLGPGDLYSSLLANCVIGGMSDAIKNSSGKFVFATNLMTRPGQTPDLSASDHVREVARYVGQLPDVVIVNTGEIPPHLLERYAQMGQFPVVDDCDQLETQIIREDLLSREEVTKNKGDVLTRSLVRGDGDKFSDVILDLL